MWHFATYYLVMAQSIRISDELYGAAQKAGALLDRSLAQQMEYWARLGAAIDAAGITSAQAMELLQAGRLNVLIAAATCKTDNEAGSSQMLRQRRRSFEKQVRDGQRKPDSLVIFTPQAVAASSRSAPEYTPDEAEGGGGW